MVVIVNIIMVMGVIWDDGDFYCMVMLIGVECVMVEYYLDIVVSDFYVVMVQIGMCDCILVSWVSGYLEKLNIIDVVFYY